ncbi:MAG TPA: hypothetical protein VFM93_13770 [Candidatus Limnocylindria bacterium]|nr:hypothetical protein [Candidatus Limnocylindria bacterium]
MSSLPPRYRTIDIAVGPGAGTRRVVRSAVRRLRALVRTYRMRLTQRERKEVS